MTTTRHPLRLNVGFIVNESVGYSRSFEFDLPELQLAPDQMIEGLKGTVLFERTQSGLLVTANFSGTVVSQCVRCLDDFKQPLNTDFTELYAFDQRNTTESELLVPEDGYIDLTPLVSEYLMLEVPIRALCKPDCAGLCPLCGANHNHEQCDCHTENIDPRLAKLKDLLDSEE